MSRYWLNPPRQHIIDWLVKEKSYEPAKLRPMKIDELRALWHREMNKWVGEKNV